MLAVFKDGVLLDVHVSFWSGGKALSAEDLGLKENEVADAFKLGKKMLIPEEVIREFRCKEQQARRIVEVNSFPFPIGHASFIPKSRVDKVVEQLKTFQQEFDALTNKLVENYDAYRTQMIPIYEEAARVAYFKSQPSTKEFSIEGEQAEEAAFVKTFMERIAGFYPTAESLRSKFRLYWDEYVIATPTFDKAEEANKAYRKNMQESMEKFVNDVVGTLRTKTVEMCSRLSENIKSGKVVRSSSLESLTKFIDEYKELNFVGDTKIEKQLDELKSHLNVESKVLNESTDIKESLGRKLTEIIESATQISDINSITGQYKRKIEFDGDWSGQ